MVIMGQPFLFGIQLWILNYKNRLLYLYLKFTNINIDYI